MRLLVDLQGMQNQSRHRGIGRYVTNLARGLLRQAGDHEIRFLLSRRFPETIPDVIQTFAGMATPDQFLVFDVPGPSAELVVENAWRSGAGHALYNALVAQLAPDALLIGSLFEGGSDDTVVSVGPPDRNYATALILYDLIPLINPAEHIGSAGARRWYFRKVEEAKQADQLLGISHSACREGIEHLACDTDPQRVQFAGAAAGEEFASIDYRRLRDHPLAEEVKAFYGITRPYIMHTSALDARKNFEGLIAAFGKLPQDVRQQHQLVLVCKLHRAGEASLRRAIAAAELGPDDVVLTGFVEDDELRVLYANCNLFVFPSFHEGFGLPVVEAMWCGAPAVGSQLSSVPEVIGRSDAQFDPSDTDGMARIIDRALTDQVYRASLLAHATAHARTFSWDAVAERALQAIEQVVSRRQRGLSHASAGNVMDRIAGLECWPQPSPADLLATATAMVANEQLDWPRTAPALQAVCKSAER